MVVLILSELSFPMVYLTIFQNTLNLLTIKSMLIIKIYFLLESYSVYYKLIKLIKSMKETWEKEKLENMSYS